MAEKMETRNTGRIICSNFKIDENSQEKKKLWEKVSRLSKMHFSSILLRPNHKKKQKNKATGSGHPKKNIRFVSKHLHLPAHNSAS